MNILAATSNLETSTKIICRSENQRQSKSRNIEHNRVGRDEGEKNKQSPLKKNQTHKNIADAVSAKRPMAAQGSTTLQQRCHMQADQHPAWPPDEYHKQTLSEYETISPCR